MEINRNSWHYRLLKFSDTVPSTSLCLYFWQVALVVPIKGLVVAVFGSLLGVCLVTFLLLFAAPLATLLFFLISDLPPSSDWVLLNLLGAIIWLIPIVLFGEVAVKKILRNKETNYTPKEPNILLEFLKAKKEKICPLIQFVDK
jgi:hypothetical protein